VRRGEAEVRDPLCILLGRVSSQLRQQERAAEARPSSPRLTWWYGMHYPK
jgi:hypothetical protein